MNEIDKKDILKKIETEISKTETSITSLIELTKPIAPDCAIGRISRMDAINNKTINENALRKAKQKLESLKIAKSNLHDFDFGICKKCQQPIPLGRILIMPHSKFCVHCATR